MFSQEAKHGEDPLEEKPKQAPPNERPAQYKFPDIISCHTSAGSPVILVFLSLTHDVLTDPVRWIRAVMWQNIDPFTYSVPYQRARAAAAAQRTPAESQTSSSPPARPETFSLLLLKSGILSTGGNTVCLK